MNVTFPSLNLINKTTPIRFSDAMSFCGKKKAEKDTFERSGTQFMTSKTGEKMNAPVMKNVTFDKREGGTVQGYIVKDPHFDNQYFAISNGKEQCRMILNEHKDEMFIEELYGNRNKGEVKGAGTELLKFASEMSEKKGYKGRLSLIMAGSYPFYFKNNLRVDKKEKHANKTNAALDYITRTGTASNKVWRNTWWATTVRLSPKGAKALKEGRRLMDESKSQILYSKTIPHPEYPGELNFDMDFSDLGKNFVIQMIDKDATCNGQVATLEGKIKKGKLIPKDHINLPQFRDETGQLEEEFKTALKTAQEVYSG